MKRKYIVISLISVSILGGLFNGFSYAISSETQAKIVAEKEFPVAINEMKHDYKDYHFEKLEDVSNAYLGDPIESDSLDEDRYVSTKSVDEQLTGASAYIFPIMVNGKPVTDIIIALTTNHEWKLMNFGGHMSSSIQSIKSKYNIHCVKIMSTSTQTFIIGNDKNNDLKIIEDVGINGYRVCDTNDIKKVINQEKKMIQERKKYYEQHKSIRLGGPMIKDMSKKPSQEPALNRLIKYIKHIF